MEELHIPYSQWRRRKEDLKEWIEDNHYVLDDNRIRTQVTK